MSNEIVAYIDPTSLNQKVLFPEGDLRMVSTAEFGRAIIPLCKEHNLFNLHLFGHDEFIEGIVEEIKCAEAEVYGVNKIKVEVN